MFCTVCGLRVRVWESYRTSRNFEYGYGSVTELPEVPGIVARAYRNSQKFRVGTKSAVPRTPGIVAWGVQNSQTFRVRV